MHLYLKRSLVIFLFFFSSQISAQRPYSLVHDVPVKGDRGIYTMPWAGGLNSVILQTADISGNGMEELISFDRSIQSFMVFSREGNTWVARPHLLCNLPVDVTNWFLMKDYDGDGKKDLFTFTPGGIRVFRNISSPGQAASWEFAETLLNYTSNNFQVNLLVNSSDLPAIEDVDGDGDLDILAYDPFGGGGLEFYRNMSMEETGRPGLSPFVKENGRWGGLSECDCGDFAYENELCKNKGADLRELHAGGKSLLLIDVDGDGDFDLLNGFEECTELYYLENKGTNLEPYFDGFEIILPGAGEAISMPYPAAFEINLGMSASSQLAIGSQLGNNALRHDLSENIWLFDQEQSGGIKEYELITRSFLQDEMIDAGESAIPAFIDLDGDGVLDMLLGSAGKPHEEGFFGELQYYRNHGTAENPAFELVDDDFLQLSSLRLYQLHPQVIDFNNDGMQDLVLIASESERFQRKVFLFTNQGSAEVSEFSLSNMKELNTPINIQLNPFFFDVNVDGKPDLLMGKFDGSLSLFENSGTPESPAFGPEIRNYMGMGLDNYRRPLVPSVGDLSGNGKPDLLLADGTGQIRFIEDFLQENSALEIAEFEFCGGEGAQISWFGRKSWPVVAPLKSQKAPLVAVGSLGGGIWLLETELPSATPGKTSPELIVFPNPVGHQQQSYVLTNKPATIRLISVIGQVLLEMCVEENVKTELSVADLPPAIYIVQAIFQEGKRSSLLMIAK